MNNLTIELPETIAQQVQARGLSRQQVETLVIHFLQRYLRDRQPEPNGELVFDKNPTKSKGQPALSAYPAHSTAATRLDEAAQLRQMAQAKDDPLFMTDLREIMVAFSETDAMGWVLQHSPSALYLTLC